jgi:spore coat protein JB
MATANAKQLKVLEELQSIDFVITELSLYLDTHPSDEKALKQFNQTADRRKEYKDRVEAEFGSLCKTETYNSGKTSGWDAGPWPWQL